MDLTDHSSYISLPVAVMRYSDKDNLRKTELILAHSLRYHPSWLKSRSQEPEELRHTVPTVRKQDSGRLYSAGFLLFIQPEPQIQRMALSTIKMGLPTSVEVIKVIPHRHVHRPIS